MGISKVNAYNDKYTDCYYDDVNDRYVYHDKGPHEEVWYYYDGEYEGAEIVYLDEAPI